MFLYDKVIVIDIEATCWEKGQTPENQKREIIEIGICNSICQTGVSKIKEVI